ncbi:Lactate utilization protein C [Phycisphaerae bacterium RAS1]|nr:Lactate utilization protein C [Phycisphaerae bacterium RAS1]
MTDATRTASAALPPVVVELIARTARRVASDGSPPPDIAEAVTRQLTSADDRVSRFITAAKAAGSEPETVTAAELAGRVSDLLAKAGAADALLELPDFLPQSTAIRQALQGASVRMVDDRSDESLFAVRAAVTGVAAAIAETGSIVIESGGGVSRSASLVPPLHVAIVLESQLLPDLLDYFAAGSRSPPTCATLITGPSKTADIEGILVTGVHGPGRVVILVVRV